MTTRAPPIGARGGRRPRAPVGPEDAARGRGEGPRRPRSWSRPSRPGRRRCHQARDQHPAGLAEVLAGHGLEPGGPRADRLGQGTQDPPHLALPLEGVPPLQNGQPEPAAQDEHRGAHQGQAAVEAQPPGPHGRGRPQPLEAAQLAQDRESEPPCHDQAEQHPHRRGRRRAGPVPPRRGRRPIPGRSPRCRRRRPMEQRPADPALVAGQAKVEQHGSDSIPRVRTRTETRKADVRLLAHPEEGLERDHLGHAEQPPRGDRGEGHQGDQPQGAALDQGEDAALPSPRRWRRSPGRSGP